jgi:hypothetical protein
VASKIVGGRRAESAMFHGALVWPLAVPLLLVLAALGAGSYFGAWYGGMAGTPTWVTPPSGPVDPDGTIATCNRALDAIMAVLLGLVGSVIGAWLGLRKPMASSGNWTPPCQRDISRRPRSALVYCLCDPCHRRFPSAAPRADHLALQT